MDKLLREWGERPEFPSPFGVRVLKYLARYGFIRGQKFPSPFGVRVLKLNTCAMLILPFSLPFPSPFGVRVLK